MHRHALRTALVAVLLGWGVAIAAPSTELGEAVATIDADADHGGQARLRGTGPVRDALRLPALDLDVEMAAKAARAAALRDGQPLQIGIARDTGKDLLGAGDLAWQRQSDGAHVARLRVGSAGAVALRSGILLASPANLSRPGKGEDAARLHPAQAAQKRLESGPHDPASNRRLRAADRAPGAGVSVERAQFGC